MVDITQSPPRWGRTEETMGEDAYLASELGIVQVRAFQGRQCGPGTGHCAVTLKHLGIHCRSEGGCNTAPSFVDEHTAREPSLYPFERCIKEAQPWNVMACYAHMWGTPSAHEQPFDWRHTAARLGLSGSCGERLRQRA